MVFLSFMIVVLVPSVMEFAASSFHCPNAVEVLSSSTSGGSVQMRAGSATTTATSVTTLSCIFADGSEKTIGNDTMFLTGVGIALGIGALSGLAIALILAVFSRLKKR